VASGAVVSITAAAAAAKTKAIFIIVRPPWA
jgi:hypothetical protein